mgnify:CR=1 FL=1
MSAGTIGLLLFCVFFFLLFIGSPIMVALGLSTFAADQIGRASCRERV